MTPLKKKLGVSLSEKSVVLLSLIHILIKISNALEITIDELLYGNLLYNPTEYQTDIDLLMADCTSTEKRYIFEVLSAIKNILRINDWHLSSKHNYDADNPNDY